MTLPFPSDLKPTPANLKKYGKVMERLKKRIIKPEDEFFNQLADKLNELYPKGNKDRGKALVFNAWANLFFRQELEKVILDILEIINEETKKNWENQDKADGYNHCYAIVKSFLPKK